jgi:hypothetical protein
VGISVSGLYQEQALTNVSVMYRNADFVAEQVMPIVPVNKQSGKYFVYGLDNLRAQEDARRPGTMSNEIAWSLSKDTYFCDGHALHQYIPDEWRETADAAIDLDTDTTIQLTDKIFLNREIALVAALAAAMTPASQATQYWDDDDVDPVMILDEYKETVALAIGRKPNSLVLSRPVFRGLRNNYNVKRRISGAPSLDASLITQQQLANVLEIDNLIVAESVKVTTAEGIAPTAASYVWGDYGLLFFRPPSPGLRTVSLGYHYTWNTGRLGSLVYKDRAPKRHSDWIEVMRYFDQKVVAAAAGVLCSNCVSA